VETVILKGRRISSGIAEGEALVTTQAFGFSHGVEPATGRVSDESHEWLGQNIKGKVLIFPYGKGSLTGGLWILETARLNNTPAAVINLDTDPIIAAGFIMAKLLYGKEIPIVDQLDFSPIDLIETGDWVRVNANNGIIETQKKQTLP